VDAAIDVGDILGPAGFKQDRVAGVRPLPRDPATSPQSTDGPHPSLERSALPAFPSADPGAEDVHRGVNANTPRAPFGITGRKS